MTVYYTCSAWDFFGATNYNFYVGWRFVLFLDREITGNLVALEFLSNLRSHGMLVKVRARTCGNTDAQRSVMDFATTVPPYLCCGWGTNDVWNRSMALHVVAATWLLTADTTGELEQSEVKTRDCFRQMHVFHHCFGILPNFEIPTIPLCFVLMALLVRRFKIRSCLLLRL